MQIEQRRDRRDRAARVHSPGVSGSASRRRPSGQGQRSSSARAAASAPTSPASARAQRSGAERRARDAPKGSPSLYRPAAAEGLQQRVELVVDEAGRLGAIVPAHRLDEIFLDAEPFGEQSRQPVLRDDIAGLGGPPQQLDRIGAVARDAGAVELHDGEFDHGGRMAGLGAPCGAIAPPRPDPAPTPRPFL